MTKKEGGLVGYMMKQKGGKAGASMFPTMDQMMKPGAIRAPKAQGMPKKKGR